MAVASSQVGQVFTGPLFSIYVGVATIFNDQFSHSWSKGPHFTCPPDHSITVCYGLAVYAEVWQTVLVLPRTVKVTQVV